MWDKKIYNFYHYGNQDNVRKYGPASQKKCSKSYLARQSLNRHILCRLFTKQQGKNYLLPLDDLPAFSDYL